MNLRTTAVLVAMPTVAALALAGCTASEPEPEGPVTISVMGLPAATNEATRDAFLADVEAFEDQFPDITIEPTDETYDPATFATQLAGGQVSTVMVLPFTAPAALIERGQVADISAEVEEIAGLDTLNPAALNALEQDGALYGLPENVYALGLVYNRVLFEQAGLDPDNPPATWDEVREAADAIAEATGVAGFASMTTEASGGWQLTAQTVASGEQMQVAEGEDFVSNVDNDAAREILEWHQGMRWEDDSIGSNILRSQQDVERAFAVGEAAMIIATPSYFNRFLNQYDGQPDQFGVTSMPQANDAGQTLIGGSALMVPATATDAERAAAVEWINYRYIQPKSDAERAATQAEAESADGVAVGIPLLPLFNQETQDRIAEAIEPYVNIPMEQFMPYIEGVQELEYVAEPPFLTQEMYQVLSSVVQEVLTQEGADIDALLASADEQVSSLLASQP